MFFFFTNGDSGAGGGSLPPAFVEYKENEYQATGTLLNTWLDSSGNAVDATSVGALRPTINTSSINSINTVNFNGTDLMTVAAALNTLPTGDFTIFCVMNSVTLLQSAILGSTTTNPAQNFSISLSSIGGTSFVSFNCGISTAVSQAANYDNNPLIICAVRSGTTLSLSVNNSIPSVNSNASNVDTIIDIRLGADQSALNFFNGQIGQIRFYNVALTTSQVSRVFRSLNRKWGITLQDRSISYITGLLAQYDFKDIATVTLDSGKYVSVLDKSGRNLTLQQTKSTLAPTSDGVMANFTTAPSFTGGQYMSYLGAIGLSGSAPFTVFVVAQTSNIDTQRGPITFGALDYAQNEVVSIDINFIVDGNGFRTNNSSIRYGTIYPFNSSFVMAVSFFGDETSNVNLYVDGEVQTPTGDTNPLVTIDLTDQQLLIGAFGTDGSTDPNLFWQGALGFVGIWEGVMPFDNLNETFAQLTNRFLTATSDSILLEGSEDLILLEESTDNILLEF